MNLYHATILEPISNEPGAWNSIRVAIWVRDGPDGLVHKAGEYTRNYPELYRTFYPFEQDGKEYALYSPKYTATRLLSLPNGMDIGGEHPASGGFCPTDYYVPPQAQGRYGFVAGCIWGDDTSWKIQYLDLSRVSEGIVTRDERFGYIELPDKMNLEDAIEDYGNGYLKITHFRIFKRGTGEAE